MQLPLNEKLKCVCWVKQLPFNEDLRRAPFSALKGNTALQPSTAQLDATRAFVAALDITRHKNVSAPSLLPPSPSHSLPRRSLFLPLSLSLCSHLHPLRRWLERPGQPNPRQSNEICSR